MAATYLTIGSKFQPFSFAEMVQPLQMYGQEYQRQEDLYNTYAETAGLIGADLNPTLDRDILDNTYNPYMQALNEGADILATEGLSPGGRKKLQELRRRFGREITPIKVASEARTKARENWDKMLAQDKTLMTNANPYYKGISAYMNGASPDTTYVSGNELYSRGQNLAEAFSKTMREVPEDERLALQGQYFRIVNQYGADSAEADAFMQGAIDRIPALAKQVDEILANSGIDAKGFTPADKERARQCIIEGMKAGLSGETKVDYLQNRAWDLAAKAALEGPKEDPLSVITFTGGVDSTKNPTNDRLVTLAEAITPGAKEGTYTTPEIERRRGQIPFSDEELAEYYKLTDSFESLYGRLETRRVLDKSGGWTGETYQVRVFPDGTEISATDPSLGPIPAEDQKRYSDLRSKIAKYDDYRRDRRDLDNLVETAKFFAGENASPNEVRNAAIRYASYLRNKQSTESVRINASLKDSALNNKVMMDWTNAVSGELEQGRDNSISIVENGISRPLNKSEVEELQNILSDSTNFTVHFDSTVKDKNGVRTPIVFTYKGTGDDDAISFTINSDIHRDMVREYNTVSDFLTDFEPSSLENAPTLYNPSYAEVLNLSKGKELPGGIQGLIYYDGSSGEYVKAVALKDRSGNVRIFSETMTDLAQLDRGGHGLGDYIEFVGEEFLRTTYGK